MDGMSIHNPAESDSFAYLLSRVCTSKLVTAIKGKDQFSLADHVEKIASGRVCFYNNLRSHDESKLESVLEVIGDKKSKCITRAINEKTSN